jgi:hypothetical protein
MAGLLEFAASLPHRALDAGEVLVREGHPVAALYILVDGPCVWRRAACVSRR